MDDDVLLLPDPPIAADTDCRDLDGFMLHVERLMASELVAVSSHEVVAAALYLWCRAWKQIPAASLPDNDEILAGFAHLPLRRFRKSKMAITRGFVKCNDGRLYHSVLAAEAGKAYEKKKAFKIKRERDADRLRKWRSSRGEGRDDMRMSPPETGDEMRFVAEGQGQGQIVRKKEGESGPPSESYPENHQPTNTRLTAQECRFGFIGKIIHLTKEDLERWRSVYHEIADIVPELEALDAFYDAELSGKERSKWFVRCSSALNKKHQERINIAKAEKLRDEFRSGNGFGSPGLA